MELHMLCGIPGSGKSTLVGRLSGHVVSTDSLRKYLWGDESVVTFDTLVFTVADDIMKYLLGIGRDVIFDATNLTIDRRKAYITLAHMFGGRVVLHWVNCPLSTALERNSIRERKVPVPVIKALYNSFQMPSSKEGLDVIKVYGQELVIQRIVAAGHTIKRSSARPGAVYIPENPFVKENLRKGRIQTVSEPGWYPPEEDSIWPSM
ncbi:MAG TPA: ATP-binding protein [Desulfobacteria bacterium]|nr:ATP-binding protein [Desulfobacteria bacterium]